MKLTKDYLVLCYSRMRWNPCWPVCLTINNALLITEKTMSVIWFSWQPLQLRHMYIFRCGWFNQLQRTFPTLPKQWQLGMAESLYLSDPTLKSKFCYRLSGALLDSIVGFKKKKLLYSNLSIEYQRKCRYIHFDIHSYIHTHIHTHTSRNQHLTTFHFSLITQQIIYYFKTSLDSIRL